MVVGGSEVRLHIHTAATAIAAITAAYSAYRGIALRSRSSPCLRCLTAFSLCLRRFFSSYRSLPADFTAHPPLRNDLVTGRIKGQNWPNPTNSDEAAGSVTLRSEEHTSELQSLMRISYAVFCLKKKT